MKSKISDDMSRIILLHMFGGTFCILHTFEGTFLLDVAHIVLTLTMLSMFYSSTEDFRGLVKEAYLVIIMG